MLGADTVVVLDGEVMGKPDDPEHAIARLVGRRPAVITGMALARSDDFSRRCPNACGRVSMRPTAREARIIGRLLQD